MIIDHDMERIGQIMSADQDLIVECRGMMAFASPGRVVIPSLENLDYLGRDAERMMHGYLDHECAHATFTDFSYYEKAYDKDPQFKELFNAIEDGFIEKRQGLRFKGSRWNLEQKNRWFWEREDEEGRTVPKMMVDPKIDEWRKFTVALTTVLRPGGKTVEDFEELDKTTHQRLLECEEEINEVYTISDVPGDNPHERLWAVAESIWDQFVEDDDNPLQMCPPTTIQLEQCDLPPNPEAAVTAILLAVLGGVDFGAKDFEEDEAEGGDGDGTGAGDGAGDGDGAGGDDMGGNGTPKMPDPDNPGDNYQKIRSDKPYIIFSHEYDNEIDFTGDVSMSGKYEDLVSETREATEALVHAFEAALLARRQKAASYGHDEGEIDPIAMAQFAVGSRDPDTIFTQYTAEEDDQQGVAVHVLVDCSGSMGNYDHHRSKSRLAAQAATAIHRACAACAIPHEVGGFTTCYSQSYREGHWSPPEENWQRAHQHLAEAQAKGQNIGSFARILSDDYYEPFESELCAPTHAIFKSFESDDARGISQITGQLANLDGEAVLWAARRLAQRPEKRRVLFVLSDGLPSGAYDADEHGYLRENVARIIDSGIEVYGLGIKSPYVSEFYPVHWIIDELEQLPVLAMEAFIDVFSENRQERAWIEL